MFDKLCGESLLGATPADRQAIVLINPVGSINGGAC